MSGEIPASGRGRLLISARQRLPESVSIVMSVIPVTLDGWNHSLTDAGLSGSDGLGFKELDDLLDPVNLTDSGRLVRSSIRFACSASRLSFEDLACLGSPVTIRVRGSARTSATRCYRPHRRRSGI